MTPTNGKTTVTNQDVVMSAKRKINGLEAASAMLTAGKPASDIVAALALLQDVPVVARTADEVADLQAQLDAARAENAALRTAKINKAVLGLKVSEKGAVSIYGVGRFPVTLYKEQMLKVLGAKEKILAFMEEHNADLVTKPIA